MECIRYYTIAGQSIQISGKGLESFSGFDVFRSEKPESTLLLVIDMEAPVEDWDIPPVYITKYNGTIYDLSVKDNAFLFRMKAINGNCFLAEIRSEGAGFHAAIHHTGEFNKGSLYFALWMLIGIAVLSRQVVSIHSSAIMYQGKSILFLGESGTGKSTHTRLWLNHIPNTELLNDDSPFLRVEAEGNIQVYGSPWSGKTPCYKNIHTPVAAFVRLSQALYNRIRRLTGIEAIGALLPSFPFVFACGKQLSKSIYSILSCALQQTPVYHLECLPDADAARLVFTTLERDNYLGVKS